MTQDRIITIDNMTLETKIKYFNILIILEILRIVQSLES